MYIATQTGRESCQYLAIGGGGGGICPIIYPIFFYIRKILTYECTPLGTGSSATAWQCLPLQMATIFAGNRQKYQYSRLLPDFPSAFPPAPNEVTCVWDFKNLHQKHFPMTIYSFLYNYNEFFRGFMAKNTWKSHLFSKFWKNYSNLARNLAKIAGERDFNEIQYGRSECFWR